MTGKQNRLYEELKYLCEDLFDGNTEEMLFDILTVMSFIVEDIKTHLIGNVFAVDSYYSNAFGPNEIKGVSANGTLTSYSIKNLAKNISDESFIKFDIYTPIEDRVLVILKKQSGVEFRYELPLKGGEFWQNFTINFTDFKDLNGLPLKQFNDIESVSIKAQGTLMINNFILI